MTAPAFLVLPSRTDSYIENCITVARNTIPSGSSEPLPSARAQQVPVYDVSPGRHRDTLRGRDAFRLYKALHEGRVLVLAFGDIWVRTDPRRRAVDRAAIPLKRFVQHKSTFGLVHGPGDVARFVAAHATWSASERCTGDDDPRVLPLHSFTTNEDWPDLESESAVDSFAARYG